LSAVVATGTTALPPSGQRPRREPAAIRIASITSGVRTPSPGVPGRLRLVDVLGTV